MLIASLSINAQSPIISDFIAKYENNDQFTSVYVSPKMIDMVTKVAEEDIEGELQDVLKDLKGLQVLTTEIDAMKYYKELESGLNGNNFDLLMKVREEDQNVKIFSKGSSDIVDEIAILVGGVDEFVLVSLVGKLDLDKIGKLAEGLDVKGAKHLKNIDKNGE